MTLTAFLLSFLFATVLGLLFHVIIGGRGWRILFFILLSWMGFFLGNIAGRAIGWHWLNVGPIYTVPASLGSIITLLLGLWLSKLQKTNTKTS